MFSNLGTCIRQKLHLKWCDAAASRHDSGQCFPSTCCALEVWGSLPSTFCIVSDALNSPLGVSALCAISCMRKVSTETWSNGSSHRGGEGAGFYFSHFAVGVVLLVALLKCPREEGGALMGGGEGLDQGQWCSQWSDHVADEPVSGRRNAELEEKGQGHGREGLETRSRLSVVEGIKVSVGVFLSLHFTLLQRMD